MKTKNFDPTHNPLLESSSSSEEDEAEEITSGYKGLSGSTASGPVVVMERVSILSPTIKKSEVSDPY